jgi:hypothetical protein
MLSIHLNVVLLLFDESHQITVAGKGIGFAERERDEVFYLLDQQRYFVLEKLVGNGSQHL